MGSSLQDMLKGDKPGAKSSAAHFQNMSDIISGERAYKIQVEGEKKCGKTRFCLSILNYLYYERGLNPDEILIVWIDLDNGLVPLVKQDLIPKDLIKCIEYHLCLDFGEVIEKTDEGIDILNAHIKKHGSAGAWLIVDNMGKAWEGARDYYSRAVYGKPMKELLIEAKQRALDRSAAKRGKKHGRIPAQEFDQLTDYGIINPLHNDWADKIKDSNVNFVWTALLKYEEKEVRGNRKTVIARGEGQKHNAARVDFIVRKKLDEGRYLTDLHGSRYTSNLFRNEEDLEFVDFVENINNTMEIEKKKRDRHWVKKNEERARTIDDKRKSLGKDAQSDEKPSILSDVIESDTKSTKPDKPDKLDKPGKPVEQSTLTKEVAKPDTVDKKKVDTPKESTPEKSLNQVLTEKPKESPKATADDDDDDWAIE